MRVTQRTEYGIRAMIGLAKDFDELVSLRDLAGRESIPQAFLERILADLRKAGLVTTARGSKGGYRLSASPGRISIGQIVSTLEGSLSPARCGQDCVRQSGCQTRSVMEKIEQSITETLDDIRLGDLVEKELA